eukprot:scaffold120506_cov36-Tisochrysis_lutea.AAC.2
MALDTTRTGTTRGSTTERTGDEVAYSTSLATMVGPIFGATAHCLHKGRAPKYDGWPSFEGASLHDAHTVCAFARCGRDGVI